MSKESFDNIGLDQLYFDPDNPRLPPRLQGEKDEAPVIEHMLRDQNLVDLMQSIGQMGYSDSEPLLVVPRSEGGYTVVEGNRRLAALKLLSNPSLATVRRNSVQNVVEEAQKKPDLIPVIKHENRDDILDYLGYRHITGVKNWGALEKARYLHQLYVRHKDSSSDSQTFRALAKMIGSRSDYVGKLLVSLKLYEQANDDAYYDVEVEEKDISFSLLSTAISYENIYKFIGLKGSSDLGFEGFDKENFEFVFKKLYDPKQRIDESRQLSQLSEVVGNAEALKQYKAGASLNEAVWYTGAPLKAFGSFLNEAKRSLDSADRIIKGLDESSEEDNTQYGRILKEIMNTAKGIQAILQGSAL